MEDECLMSLQWEPVWEEVKIEYKGIRLIVPVDRVTRLYACPICGLGDSATYSFTVKDLIQHIHAHVKKVEGIPVMRARTVEEEEEGEEESEEEED